MFELTFGARLVALSRIVLRDQAKRILLIVFIVWARKSWLKKEYKIGFFLAVREYKNPLNIDRLCDNYSEYSLTEHKTELK